MSFSTFNCCVCGKPTTKPKSYAVPGKGRACREHPESQTARQGVVFSEEHAKRARELRDIEQKKEIEEQKKRKMYGFKKDDPIYNHQVDALIINEDN